MTRLLSLFGLMRVSEHERVAENLRELSLSRNQLATDLAEADAALIARENELAAMADKFKTAVADLEKKAGEMRVTDGLLTDAQMEAMELRHEIECLKSTFNQRLADSVQDYQADALAMRRKRQMDRDRRKGNG